VFGVGAVDSYAAGMDVDGHFSVLVAELLVALVGAPLATAAALRTAMD
jgi:heme exporter protein B